MDPCQIHGRDCGRRWRQYQLAEGEIADEQVAKIRRGERVTPAEMQRSFDEVKARTHAKIVESYLSQVKWSLINEEDHGGWPFRSQYLVRSPQILFDGLRKIVQDTDDPVARFALIFSALYVKNERAAGNTYLPASAR